MTVSDPNAPGKENRFVGICIEKKNFGLGASFKLRNCIDEQGKDQLWYNHFSPFSILQIVVVKKVLSVPNGAYGGAYLRLNNP